jgi:aminoglycoside 6-adenylyltransferase
MSTFPAPVERMIAWAQSEAAIRAMLLVGSRARTTDHPPDEWADHDLTLYATHVPIDPASRQWAEAFGVVWFYIPTTFEDGTPHPLIVYDGAQKVDVSFEAVGHLAAMIADQRLDDPMQRGYRVLIDKDGLTAKLPPPTPPVFTPPTEDEYQRVFDGFWFGTLYVALQIRRRNLWVVKFREGTARESLLRMLEWHAESTWHDGHYMVDWLDPALYAKVGDLFGGFDAAASWRSLRAMIALFTRAAGDVAERCKFAYPVALEHELDMHIKRLYWEDANQQGVPESMAEVFQGYHDHDTSHYALIPLPHTMPHLRYLICYKPFGKSIVIVDVYENNYREAINFLLAHNVEIREEC